MAITKTETLIHAAIMDDRPAVVVYRVVYEETNGGVSEVILVTSREEEVLPDDNTAALPKFARLAIDAAYTPERKAAINQFVADRAAEQAFGRVPGPPA